ncbi:SDR family NAD(P)-dependent oxidoreductase [Pseudonocardia sp. GCM10023141]|uniref:SDR family NAD(P)-dependent oxidoreductase n=1 Tax=Pseudonocardia sp. GCM10023141 TaxID=3252653 RepID=UPI00360D25F8
MDLQGAAAIVTGGASGLGEASARRLAELGAHVVIADRQEEQGKQVADDVGGVFVACDVTSEDDVATAVAAAGELGPLRALVNSAGVGRAGRTVGRDNVALAQSAFEFVIRVNLLGTFNVLRQAAAAMALISPVDADGNRGAVVNVASVAAFDGQIGQAAYSASKGGIVGMTLPIARDLAAVGIRVNTVAPGLVDTPIYGSGARAEEFKARLGESVLFPHRLGTADELASMIVECLTNSYVNGEVVRVDGGIRLPPR